jgi:hypothetical protein
MRSRTTPATEPAPFTAGMTRPRYRDEPVRVTDGGSLMISTARGDERGPSGFEVDRCLAVHVDRDGDLVMDDQPIAVDLLEGRRISA